MLNKSVSANSAHTTHIHIGNKDMTTMVANTFNLIGFYSTANWFKKLGAELTRRKQIRHTIKELQKLTNHELTDIGIARGDIWYIAQQSYPKALGGDRAEVNRNLRGWV